jgi:Hint domain
MANTEIFANAFRLSGTGTEANPYRIADANPAQQGLQAQFQNRSINDVGGDDRNRLGDVSGDTSVITPASGAGQYTYLGTATVGGNVEGIVAARGADTLLLTHETTATFSANQAVMLNSSTPGALGSNQWLLSGSTAEGTVVCFYPGTLIGTPEGERTVETLSIGDVVLTAEGKAAPVRWMGRHTVHTLFADPMRVMPIRIGAGAVGYNLPTRDLLVSPDHAILLDGMLIQAGALVNGVTITRERAVPAVFTYHHVELADHSLILAEGLPAETFVDNVGRLAFDNWNEHETLHGQEVPIAEMALPRAKSARQVPGATRRRLAAYAAGMSGGAAVAA